MKSSFKRVKLWILAFILWTGSSLLPLALAGEDALHRIETIIHLHSQYSFRGTLTPEEIVRNAKEKGIDALIFTDDALVKITYGLFPFRRLLRLSVEEVSVFKKGLRRYLREIEALKKKYPDLLVIAGLEVTPFYYWEKSPLTSHGIVRDWNKHLLVIGLDEKELASLPLTGRGFPTAKPFHGGDLLRLWGVVVLGFGLFCLRKGAVPIGWILIFVGTLSSIENFPFRDPVTIYHPDGKHLVYQRLIDDVQKKGGLVFWAHPEGKMMPHTFGPVTFVTDPYPEALLETKNYTGFAVFFEGFKTIGTPGGIWDQLLMAYCRGERPSPVWAIGELDYSEEGRSATWIDTVKTIVLSKGKDARALYEALRRGRMVALRRPREGEIHFGHFWVEDTHTRRFAILGETLKSEGFPQINFAFSYRGTVPPVQIRLLRDGEIIEEWRDSLPIGKAYVDSGFEGPLSYYRIEIQSGGGDLLVTNPIFVSKKEK